MTFLLILIVGVIAVGALNRANALRADLKYQANRLSGLSDRLNDAERKLGALNKSEAPPQEMPREEAEEVSEEVPSASTAIPRARPVTYVASTEKSDGEPAPSDEPPVPDTDGSAEQPPEPAGAYAQVDDGDAATVDEADAGVGIETRLGTVWTLRVGLGLLAIAAAYYARAIFPTLSPAWKVTIAYAGAVAFFALGKVFERKLARFARPVMAGGLALGFFVSYAAYFVIPMRAVSLPVSLAWMTVGVGAILVFAERWRSQPLAGLAIVLGHTSAYVAAGSADSFSLVIITALSIVAVALLVRHDWVELALFAVVTAYAAHILWSLAEHPPVAADSAFWVNVAFFASYYVVFLVGDIVWWRRVTRESPRDYRRFEHLAGRLVGAVNVTLFLSAVCYLYVATNVYLTDIHWFFFVLAAVQEAHALYLKSLGNDDYVFYPGVGTILVTLGFISAFGALSLNLVLAVEALLLLILAHRTRVWIFHPLAQLALVLNFVHSWVYAGDVTGTVPVLVGLVAVVAVYMVMAWLEDQWYGPDADADWEVPRVSARLPFDSASRFLAERFDEFYSRVAPYLCYLHAAAGALILSHQAVTLLDAHWPLVLITAAMIVLLLVTLVLCSAPLAVGYVVLQWGIAYAAHAATSSSDWVSWSAVTAGFLGALVLTCAIPARFREDVGRQIVIVASHAAVWAAIVTVPVALTRSSFGDFQNLLWIAPLAMLFAQQERVSTTVNALVFEGAERLDAFDRLAGAIACLAGGALLVLWTADVGESAGLRADFAAPALLALWSGILFVVSGLRNCARIYVGGATVLALCYMLIVTLYSDITDSVLATVWVVGVTLGIAGAQDWRLADDTSPEKPNRVLRVTTYAAYTLGLLLLFALFSVRIGFPWSVVAMAAMPFALVVFYKRFSAESAAWVALLSLLILQAGTASALYLTEASADRAILLPAICLTILAVGYERILNSRIPLPSFEDDANPSPTARLILVTALATVAMVAVYRSESLSGGWVTASWSIIGAVLMVLGFAWKSASYRRIALVVLALGLIRVFVVDIRNLTDQAKVLAFATLGACLIAVAWLYSRFAKDVKKWL